MKLSKFFLFKEINVPEMMIVERSKGWSPDLFFVITQYSVIALLSFYIERKLFPLLKLWVYSFAVIFVRMLRK